MATLKSPRNSRNKSRWAQGVKLLVSNKTQSLKGHSDPKSRHKLQSFLRNSAHWVVSESVLVNHTSLWLPEHIDQGKPPVHIKYGKRRINYSKVYPFSFHTECRSQESLAQLVLWSNSVPSSR